MKYNSIGQQLIAKAKELDPSYKPDKFNDMSEALNIILNNIEINGSNFQIIDVTSDGNLSSIASLYSKITQIVDTESLNFSNQSAIYNNIVTAVNDGLVPILKFTDGYGYYKEYLSSSSEYVFSINHFILNSEDTRSNIIITLTVGNTKNSEYYANLFKIPNTIVIQEAFSDSGSINNLDEMLSVLSGVASTSFGKIGGLFLYNVAETQLYNIYSLNPQATGSDAMLEAYTIINNKIVYIKFTAGQGRYDYTKTTYALGGGGESATKMVMLGTLSNSGTLEADKLQELFTLLENGQNIQAAFGYGEAEFITANAYSNGSLMGIVAYDVSNSLNAVNLSINPEDGNYTITTIEISGGGSATKMVNLGTLTNSGTLDAGKLQELMTLVQNEQITQTYFSYSDIQFFTANAYFGTDAIGIVAYGYGLDTLFFVNLSINTTNGNYTITPVFLPTSFKKINDYTITGSGNIEVQEPLVSGTNIKTVNGQSILGRGNIEISGGESNSITIDLGELTTNGTLSSEILAQIKNNVGSKNITFVGTVNGVYFITTTYYAVSGISLIIEFIDGNTLYQYMLSLTNGTHKITDNIIVDTKNLKKINGQSLFGTGNIAVQEPLVSGTNIKTVNGQTILGSGDLPITTDITYATDNEVNNLFTNPGQAIPEKTISLENLNAFKQQIDNEINNEIGQVLEEGF